MKNIKNMNNGFAPLEGGSWGQRDRMLNNSPCEVRISAKRHGRFLTGFTLVEVLIVVVIIAILAALILPRLTIQTEKAYAAEAFQMIGVIKRAAERAFDVTGSFPVGSADSDFGGSTNPDWGLLGLQDLGDARHWAYFYWSDGTTFTIRAQNDGSTENVVYSSNMGWTCGGTLFKQKIPGDMMSGCTV